jgi:hypothetical protein
MIRNLPSPEGAAMGRHVARFVAAALAKRKKRYPNHKEPCGTCAFRLGTVANRCAATQMDALKCLIEGNQFDCHEKKNEGCVCVGYFLLAEQTTLRSVGKAPWPWSLSEEDQQLLEATK